MRRACARHGVGVKRARSCEHCGALYVPGRAPQRSRFCSWRCRAESEGRVLPPRPRYVYDGRLSAELQREVAAARAEMATAPLFRPGSMW
jgi:hypothetical protein